MGLGSQLSQLMNSARGGRSTLSFMARRMSAGRRQQIVCLIAAPIEGQGWRGRRRRRPVAWSAISMIGTERQFATRRRRQEVGARRPLPPSPSPYDKVLSADLIEKMETDAVSVKDFRPTEVFEMERVPTGVAPSATTDSELLVSPEEEEDGPKEMPAEFIKAMEALIPVDYIKNKRETEKVLPSQEQLEQFAEAQGTSLDVADTPRPLPSIRYTQPADVLQPVPGRLLVKQMASMLALRGPVDRHQMEEMASKYQLTLEAVEALVKHVRVPYIVKVDRQDYGIWR